MNKFDKIRDKILEGKSDANINFEDLRSFLLNLEILSHGQVAQIIRLRFLVITEV